MIRFILLMKYAYHSSLTIQETNKVFHTGRILKIDGINIRRPFSPCSPGIESILFSPEQTL